MAVQISTLPLNLPKICDFCFRFLHFRTKLFRQEEDFSTIFQLMGPLVRTDGGVGAGEVVQRAADVGLQSLAVATTQMSRGRHGSCWRHLAQRERVMTESTCSEVRTALVLLLLLMLLMTRYLVNSCNHRQSRLTTQTSRTN